MRYRSRTALRSGPIPIGYLWVALMHPLNDGAAAALQDGGESLARLLDNLISSTEAWNNDAVSETFALIDPEEPSGV